MLPVVAARHSGVVFRHDSLLINPPIWLQIVFKWRHASRAPSLNHHFLSLALYLSLTLTLSLSQLVTHSGLARSPMWYVVLVSTLTHTHTHTHARVLGGSPLTSQVRSFNR